MTPARRGSFKAPARYTPPKFWLAYLRNMSVAFVPLLASVFVHILSQLHIVDRGNTVLTIFVVSGVAFKLAVQALRLQEARSKCTRDVHSSRNPHCADRYADANYCAGDQ